jgi:hypothetical protein
MLPYRVFYSFNNSSDAALGYPNVPLLYPFSLFSHTAALAKYCVIEKWHSEAHIQDVACPVLIFHGKKDFEIKSWQSRKLFDAVSAGKPFKKTLHKVADDGELSISGPNWYLEVYHGGHNNLASFQVVIDTMESWLIDNEI